MRALGTNPAIVAAACLVPVSAWWFLQLSAGAAEAAAAGRATSLQALEALFVARLLCVCLFAAVAPASTNIRGGRRETFARHIVSLAVFLVAAWPFIAMLRFAGGLLNLPLLVAEAVLLAAGTGSLALSSMLGRLSALAGRRQVSRLLLGVILAGAAWIVHADILNRVGFQ